MSRSLTRLAVARSFGDAASDTPPRVLLVDAAEDIAHALGDARVVQARSDRVASMRTTGFDAGILDLDATAGPIISAELLHLADRLPTVAVSADDDLLETFAARAPTTVTVRRPLRGGALRRAVAHVAELRRARRVLAVTSAALAHGSNGVALADPSDPELPIVFVSAGFEELTGYAADEVIGQNCRFLQGEAAPPATRAAIRQAIARREPGRFLLRNARKDGTPFWNELTLFPIYDEADDLLFIGGIQHDVTALFTARAELVRTQGELTAREAIYREVLERVPAAVVTADAARNVTFLNLRASALLGRNPDECVGRPLERVLGLSVAGADLVDEAGANARETECVCVVHEPVHRELGITVKRTAGGGETFLVLRDLAEDRLRERTERLAAVSTMAAGFAHEVRNPLASLRMLCETLQSEVAADGPQHDLAARMLGQIGRVERLVRSSLQFARPQRPRKGLHWPSIVLNAALEALAPRLRKTAGELRLSVSSDLPKIACDDAQLVQVLVVLVNNALDATQRADGVHLRVTRDEEAAPGGVRFAVEDDGPGVPPDMRASIFHPFFTTKPSGTGLGLSLAQQLVHENGGHLELAAKPGRGAVFLVTMPTAVEATP